MRCFNLSITDTCCFAWSGILSLREERTAFIHSLTESFTGHISWSNCHAPGTVLGASVHALSNIAGNPPLWKWPRNHTPIFPPSIHPARPLVIWLSGGGVLPCCTSWPSVKWSRGQRWSKAPPHSCSQPFPPLVVPLSQAPRCPFTPILTGDS